MEFRPCIDIHNGAVKQIIGGTLRDEQNHAKENFVSKQRAAYYASLYKSYGIEGGHVVLLNRKESPYYEQTRMQALDALEAYPNGLQVGGGISAETAPAYIRAGASHVIVTSFVFRDGEIRMDNLKELVRAVGKNRIVLDLSCKKKDGKYIVMTDRWQKETNTVVTKELFEKLSDYCAEFLLHATDVEGTCNGIEEDIVRMLGTFHTRPVTYAGGICSMHDIERIKDLGKGRVNFTVGSALDIFGGDLPFEEVIKYR